jgi:hypothetical protein
LPAVEGSDGEKCEFFDDAHDFFMIGMTLKTNFRAKNSVFQDPKKCSKNMSLKKVD